MNKSENLIAWFETVGAKDVASVGGKNASLGELIKALVPHGILVPPGFATTASAYWQFLRHNALEGHIADALSAWDHRKADLAETGRSIRASILAADLPEPLSSAILDAYRTLGRRIGTVDPAVAVRSSATAEDLPDASFAGQQESFLNVSGEAALLEACRRCYASLFTDRAISYRKEKGFAHQRIALSIGIQQMVRADQGGSGVMFSIDTETGFDKIVLINAAWGLGENVVQGTVDPDEYEVFKPLLGEPRLVPIIEKRLGAKAVKLIYGHGDRPTRNVATSRAERQQFVLADQDILLLARWAVAIESHYGRPMDIEWARDGQGGALFIVQARPETVQARRTGALKRFSVSGQGRELLRGIAIGDAAVTGEVCLIEDAADIGNFVDGAILVTRTTDPDWVPIMKRASAIITDHGGRTSHAAIVSRELGLPAVVGTGRATHVLAAGQAITLSCAQGDEGVVFDGLAQIAEHPLEVADLPKTHTAVMLNLADPAAAFRWWRLPADGVGLARMEFVISNAIRIHPIALRRFATLSDHRVKAEIEKLTLGYPDKAEFFVDQLSRGLARIAALAYPKPIIVRLSDFKSNEYAGLVGGAAFEPHEENPMIGFRGASRYYSDHYREGFELECRALRRLREEMGFGNVVVMVPFCRTPEEAEKVLAVMEAAGLKRGEKGLEVYMMAEVPSNVIAADAFARHFDGFSIGSNDLTQLTLGVDRDAELLSGLFSEENEAVKWMISHMIGAARKAHRKVGLCGQAPSDHPEFAKFLVGCGIDSISVSPDSFVAVKRNVAAAEAVAAVPTRKPAHAHG